MQVSSYLIIPLIALQRESKLPCAVRGGENKVRIHEEGRYDLEMLPRPSMNYNTGHQNFWRITNKVTHLERGSLTAANIK